MPRLPRPLLALLGVLPLAAGACSALPASPAPASPASPQAGSTAAPVVESAAAPAGCTSDTQCPGGEVCVRCGAEASCTPGCHQDSQCPPGSRCRQVQCIRCPCPGQCD